MRPTPRHAKRDRKIGVIKLVPENQLDDLAFKRLQLGKDGKDQRSQFGWPGVPADVSRPIRRARWPSRRMDPLAADRRPRPGPIQAFVAGHRVQPRAQLGSFGKAAERCGREDECVHHGIGCIIRLAQHPVAVAVEGIRIPVVRRRDARRVSCRDRRNNLAVIHGAHGS
jgi:hypothetical protein